MSPPAPPVAVATAYADDARCISMTAVLCSIMGGALLKLPRSLQTGMCCCCRDDHGEGHEGD
jgi:hypothetical protein